MIASTRPVPSTACRFPKNLSMAVPPVYRGAACDPVPVTQLCQPTGEMHHFLSATASSETARPFFSLTGSWLSVKRKESAVTPQTLIVNQRSNLICFPSLISTNTSLAIPRPSTTHPQLLNTRNPPPRDSPPGPHRQQT